MKEDFQEIKAVYSSGERFAEMRVYEDRKLKIWEKEVVASFPAQGRVLNIGCGKGREAFCLDEMGFFVTGIDISETVIQAAKAVAKAKGLDIEFQVSDGRNLDFPDASFDVVIIWAQTFGLFREKPGQQQLLKACKRVLKAGGLLSFSAHDRDFLSAHYPQFLRDGWFYPFPETDPTLHYVTYTAEELADCARNAGFQVLACKPGLVYTRLDGTILHCLGRKPGQA